MKQTKTASRLTGRLFGGGRGASNSRLPSLSALIVLVSFVAVLTVVLLATQFGSFFPIVRPGDQEIGSVAERDIVVPRDILYSDERVTQLKREAAEGLVLPVYRVNETLGRENLDRFERFRELLLEFRSSSVANPTAFLRLQVEFPGLLQRGELDALLDHPRLETLLERGREVLGQIYETGLISVAALDSTPGGAGGRGRAPSQSGAGGEDGWRKRSTPRRKCSRSGASRNGCSCASRTCRRRIGRSCQAWWKHSP